MNDAALAAKALDVFTSILRDHLRKHGHQNGAQLFVQWMIARAGRKGGALAVTIVARVAQADGMQPAKVRTLADFAATLGGDEPIAAVASKHAPRLAITGS